MRNAYALRRPVVNAYLVRERDRRRLRELVVVLLIVLSFGGGLFAYTWIHLEVMAAGYRIGKLERELRHLSEAERRLRLEASYLASPQRVEQRAVRELGLHPPTMEQVIFWEELR